MAGHESLDLISASLSGDDGRIQVTFEVQPVLSSAMFYPQDPATLQAWQMADV